MNVPSAVQGHQLALQWRRAFFRADATHLENAALRKFYERQNELLDQYVSLPTAPADASCWPAASTPNLSTEAPEEAKHLLTAEPTPSVSYTSCTSTEERPGTAVMPPNKSQHQGVDTEDYARRAILASNGANLLLLLGQAYAYVSMQSLALLANTVDAVLDFFSGVIIGLTWYVRHHRHDRTTRYRYPVGRTRLESVGVILMAVLMTALTLNVLTQSIESLVLYVSGSERSPTVHPFTRPVLIWIGVALLSKAALFLYCRVSVQDSVAALAMDHWNDCLSNMGALSAAALAQWWPPADPLGGMLISAFILRNWWRLTSRHLDQFLSRSASCRLHSVVTFAALWHDSRIRAIDRVCLYHVGPACFAEIDIVLDPQMPLVVSHDIGESLQARIECLPYVERCFVHLDFETAHRTEIEHQWPV